MKAKEEKRKKRTHVQLPWVRWETDSHRDGELLELPVGRRWLWPVLIGLGGKGDPHGTVRLTDSQMAKEADMPVEDVTATVDQMVVWKKLRRIEGGVVIRNWKKHNPPLRMLSHGQRGETATQ